MIQQQGGMLFIFCPEFQHELRKHVRKRGEARSESCANTKIGVLEVSGQLIKHISF